MGKPDNGELPVAPGSQASVGTQQDVSSLLHPQVAASLNSTTSHDASSDVRRRLPSMKSPQEASSSSIDTTSGVLEDQTSRIISLLDVLRVLLTLIGVSCALSYYLTSGSSTLWGYHPWFADPAQVAQWWKGSIVLTPEQLLAFDGSDPAKPIYLAINGKIFDVSAGGHTYGPGGSYSVFAGRDATRAFVTGCFMEDRTGDLRGAETIYVPIDDPDEIITSGQRKIRAEQETRKARARVEKEVEKWQGFYQNHKKYFEVGKLKDVPQYDGPPPQLCEQALNGRPKRKNQKTHQRPEASGKPVH